MDSLALKFTRRSQKTRDHYNYYTQPKLVFVINNPSVVTVCHKFVVVRINKNDKSVPLLNDIHDYTSQYIRDNFNVGDKIFYPIYTEVTEASSDSVELRCSLPTVYGKQKIQQLHKNAQYNTMTIETHNIWETSQKIGYNLIVTDVT